MDTRPQAVSGKFLRIVRPGQPVKTDIQANDEKAASGPRAVEFLRQLSSHDLFSPGDVADRINKKDPNALRAQHLALLDFECSRSARILHSLQDEKTLAKFKSIVTPCFQDFNRIYQSLSNRMEGIDI